MPRVDDYFNAKQIAVEELASHDLQDLSRDSGYEIKKEKLRVPFLNRVFLMDVPGFDFQDETDPDKEVPIQEQVLILHYLLGARRAMPTGDWAAYREIPGATFYWSAFVKRAIDPLKKVFGENMEALKKAAPIVGGTPIEQGDAGFEFHPFPHVPVQYILYEGDEEFPAEANILFDRGAGEVLSAEDLAWLAGMVVYRMMAMAH